ncbi:MAG: DUF3108 domain-containing protein [Opitutae bacterium]|nr:DUF3108 domain-containing protein [Opitutae bacterium]
MLFRFFLLCCLGLPLAATASYTALRDGESLRYQVSWGIFPRAAEVVIAARREIVDGRPFFRVTMDTASRGLVRALYSYDDRAEALIDEATGRIVHARQQSRNIDITSDSETKFDYDKRLVTHRDTVRPGRNRDFPIPDGEPVDLLSALVGTRDWQLPPGEKRATLIFTGNDVYPLSIYAEKIESVRTPQGWQNALLLSPRMETVEPRGVFRRGGEIKVWVSQEGERQPVRMQLKLKVGIAVLTLVERKITPAETRVAGTKFPSPATSPQ